MIFVFKSFRKCFSFLSRIQFALHDLSMAMNLNHAEMIRILKYVHLIPS